MEKNTVMNPGRDLIPTPRRFAEVPLQEKLQLITAWLDEHKAEDLVTLDLAQQGGFADALVVVTAGSMRHAQSLADGLRGLCRDHKFECMRTEGYEAAQWILVDMNDVVINIFLGPVRELYRLEDLWKAIPPRDKE